MSEVIYLYSGENKPKIKLTKINQFINIDKLLNFFNNLQKLNFILLFNLQLTITDNIKICTNNNNKDDPIFIIEFDSLDSTFNIWKTDGNFNNNLSNLINSLFINANSTTSSSNINTILNHPLFKSHKFKKTIHKQLLKINNNLIIWDNNNINIFFNILNSILIKENYINNNNKLKKDPIFYLKLKSFISISIILTKININQILFNNNLIKLINELKLKLNTNSLLQNTDNNNNNNNYTFTPSSSSSSINNNTNTTLINNYKNFFKSSVNDYERFDIGLNKKFNLKYSNTTKNRKSIIKR